MVGLEAANFGGEACMSEELRFVVGTAEIAQFVGVAICGDVFESFLRHFLAVVPIVLYLSRRH